MSRRCWWNRFVVNALKRVTGGLLALRRMWVRRRKGNWWREGGGRCCNWFATDVLLRRKIKSNDLQIIKIGRASLPLVQLNFLQLFVRDWWTLYPNRNPFWSRAFNWKKINQINQINSMNVLIALFNKQCWFFFVERTIKKESTGKNVENGVFERVEQKKRIKCGRIGKVVVVVWRKTRRQYACQNTHTHIQWNVELASQDSRLDSTNLTRVSIIACPIIFFNSFRFISLSFTLAVVHIFVHICNASLPLIRLVFWLRVSNSLFLFLCFFGFFLSLSLSLFSLGPSVIDHPQQYPPPPSPPTCPQPATDHRIVGSIPGQSIHSANDDDDQHKRTIFTNFGRSSKLYRSMVASVQKPGSIATRSSVKRRRWQSGHWLINTLLNWVNHIEKRFFSLLVQYLRGKKSICSIDATVDVAEVMWIRRPAFQEASHKCIPNCSYVNRWSCKYSACLSFVSGKWNRKCFLSKWRFSV